jgi:hypothetical protein
MYNISILNAEVWGDVDSVVEEVNNECLAALVGGDDNGGLIVSGDKVLTPTGKAAVIGSVIGSVVGGALLGGPGGVTFGGLVGQQIGRAIVPPPRTSC